MKKQTKLKLNKLKISKLSNTNNIMGGTNNEAADDPAPDGDTTQISNYMCPTQQTYANYSD